MFYLTQFINLKALQRSVFTLVYQICIIQFFVQLFLHEWFCYKIYHLTLLDQYVAISSIYHLFYAQATIYDIAL